MEPDPIHGEPSSPPIQLASFYLSQGDPTGMPYAYGRAGNPTWDALARAPAILWSETPTNPRLRVHDLGRLSELARRHAAPFVVDNTTATAALQRPLDLGADHVVTSLTKSASGHSDVLLGSVTTRD